MSDAGRTPSTVFGGPVAVVDGRGALVVSRVLETALLGGLTLERLLEVGGASAADRAAGLAAARALEDAGHTWRLTEAFRAEPAEPVAAGLAVPSIGEMDATIDTDTAAGLLGCSPSYVRRLARMGALTGVRSPRGGWQLSRPSVEARAKRAGEPALGGRGTQPNRSEG